MEKRDAKKTVILVHGLWGTDWGLRCLGRRLSDAGLAVRYYRYASWRKGLDDAARGLRGLVERTEASAVHVLGHSLGGIVIARMLESGAPARVGRVAFLGSPLQGSALIRRISALPFGRRILGPAAWEALVEGRPRPPTGHEVLVVAGTFPLGIGLLFGLERPHDGWIRVPETRVEGARTIRSGAWHFGLLFSRKVADGVRDFFREE